MLSGVGSSGVYTRPRIHTHTYINTHGSTHTHTHIHTEMLTPTRVHTLHYLKAFQITHDTWYNKCVVDLKRIYVSKNHIRIKKSIT